MKQGLLDKVAEQNHAFISSLRLVPHLKWAALRDLYCMKHKEQYPLKEWGEAVSYLLGCTVTLACFFRLAFMERLHCKGSWDRLPGTYRKILCYAEENGLELWDYSYETGVNETVIESMDQYITRIEIPVKRSR